MKIVTNKYLSMFVIASLATSTLVLFQNCSNYSGHLSTEDVDQYKQSMNNQFQDPNQSEMMHDPNQAGNNDNVPIQIDPIDSHSDLSSVIPDGTEAIPNMPNMEVPPTDTDVSILPETPAIPGNNVIVPNPVAEIPPTLPVVVNPENPTLVTPGTPIITNPEIVTPGNPVAVTPVIPPVGVTPVAPIIITPEIPVRPISGIDEDKIACFDSSEDPEPMDSGSFTNVVSSDGNVVVSSDLRPVVSSDGQVVVYGDRANQSSSSSSCVGGECSGTVKALNCSFYAKDLDKKSVLKLTMSNNNASILADKCGVKMIVYDGAEPLTLKYVKGKTLNICGNIIIQNLKTKGETDLTNVQVQHAEVKGNISSYKIDNGFRVLVGKKKAGIIVRTCSVNNKYEIVSN